MRACPPEGYYSTIVIPRDAVAKFPTAVIVRCRDRYGNPPALEDLQATIAAGAIVARFDGPVRSVQYTSIRASEGGEAILTFVPPMSGSYRLNVWVHGAAIPAPRGGQATSRGISQGLSWFTMSVGAPAHTSAHGWVPRAPNTARVTSPPGKSPPATARDTSPVSARSPPRSPPRSTSPTPMTRAPPTLNSTLDATAREGAISPALAAIQAVAREGAISPAMAAEKAAAAGTSPVAAAAAASASAAPSSRPGYMPKGRSLSPRAWHGLPRTHVEPTRRARAAKVTELEKWIAALRGGGEEGSGASGGALDGGSPRAVPGGALGGGSPRAVPFAVAGDSSLRSLRAATASAKRIAREVQTRNQAGAMRSRGPMGAVVGAVVGVPPSPHTPPRWMVARPVREDGMGGRVLEGALDTAHGWKDVV